MEQTEKKEETDKKEILFFHGQTLFDEKPHRFTLAGKCDINEMRIGIALCSDHDQFSKAEGRKRAIARIEDIHNTKGSIVILKTTTKGMERRNFNTIAGLTRFMQRTQIIEFFNLVK